MYSEQNVRAHRTVRDRARGPALAQSWPPTHVCVRGDETSTLEEDTEATGSGTDMFVSGAERLAEFLHSLNVYTPFQNTFTVFYMRP